MAKFRVHITRPDQAEPERVEVQQTDRNLVRPRVLEGRPEGTTVDAIEKWTGDQWELIEGRPPGKVNYTVIGVDRESGDDTSVQIEADNPDNARAKANLKGIEVTRVIDPYPDPEVETAHPREQRSGCMLVLIIAGGIILGLIVLRLLPVV